VLSIADSQELCGGTHARALEDIGEVRIVREEAVAAGVRRIEAVAGDAAQALDQERRAALQELADALAGKEVKSKDAQRIAKAMAGAAPIAVSVADIANDQLRTVMRVVQQLPSAKPAQRPELAAQAPNALTQALVTVLDRADAAAKKEDQSRDQAAGAGAKTLAAEARTVAGVKLVAHVLEGVDAKSLRDYADKVRDALGSGVVALGLVDGSKAHLVIAVSKDLTARIQAGALVKKLAPRIGGSGGGKPDFAQAGGPDVAALRDTLAAVGAAIEAS
jgi:alanyl-tRNA synthetase